MAVDPDSRMFMYDPTDVRSIEQKLAQEGITVDDHELPPRIYKSHYKPVGRSPLNRQKATQVALGFKEAQNGQVRAQNADRIVARDTLEKAEHRLQFLRQVQSLIDEVDAKLALGKIQERESWWRDDEVPIREAVDSWQDELPERESSFLFKYKTPKPQSPRLTKMQNVLDQMAAAWLTADIDLQARGYRPNKDKNQHDRSRGTKASKLGAGGIGAALRGAMPELFGAESYQARDGKLRGKSQSEKLAAKVEPFEEIAFLMKKMSNRAAEDQAREDRKFEGMSRSRRYGVD